MFPSNGVLTRRPLPSTGSLGLVPRPLRYSEALRLPTVPFAALRCLRLAIPPLRRSLRPAASTRDRGYRGVGVPGPEPELSVETDGPPRFPGTPPVPWPCSPTPAGPITPGHHGVSARSPLLTRTRTPAMIFRGSIARPGHSLSTLRSEGRPSPRKTRFRLLAKLCRAGFVYPQGSIERFLSFESLPPFLSFPGAMAVVFSGGKRQLTPVFSHVDSIDWRVARCWLLLRRHVSRNERH
jgi:hypothetical protein